MFLKKMTNNNCTNHIKRRDIFGFIWMAFKPFTKMLLLSTFKPTRLQTLSSVFVDLYSKLWDFSEHSISHKGFNLPSALGTSPVKHVNVLLSKLYGEQYASLSFGGSSGALLTLLTAVIPKLQPNRHIILFDDICHQSTIGGLIFGRWKTVRLHRKKHPEHQTVSPVTLETVKDIVEHHGPSQFAAIVLVLPSYDGFRSPTEDQKIYDYAHSQGIIVIVDGAWDALRFRRSKSIAPPLSSICDVWITSPHKRGLTPSSLGGILTNNSSIARLWDEALDLGFRSSSVSFIEVMIAEYRLEQVISGYWDKSFSKAERAAELLRKRIKEIHPDLFIVQPEHVQAETCDPSHILICTRHISNFDAREWAKTLSNEFALDVEKVTASTLLLLCGSPDHLIKIDEIISVLKESFLMTAGHIETLNYDT